jgi:osmoprotectant transport system ATP-binding protein
VADADGAVEGSHAIVLRYVWMPRSSQGCSEMLSFAGMQGATKFTPFLRRCQSKRWRNSYPNAIQMKPTIQFRDVTYSVNRNLSGTSGHPSTFDIVSAVSLEIHAGETLVLLGRSGSGKTTLLKLINRLLTPQKGAVIVQDRATSEWDPIALRRGIGYVIQEGGLFPHFTVAQNISLVPTLENWDSTRTRKRVQELLELVGLEPTQFADRRPNQLSGGQRQRVGVARALAADPPILLMDEPFGALDPVTRAEMQREFADISRRLGKTIVFVTHDLREARRLATRIVLLESGRIVASAKPDEFLQIDHPEVRAFAATLDTTPVDQLQQTQTQSQQQSSAPGATRS